MGGLFWFVLWFVWGGEGGVSLEYVLLLFSYFEEDAGKAEDWVLERALLSLVSSLYDPLWSLSALQKGGRRPCLLQEV